MASTEPTVERRETPRPRPLGQTSSSVNLLQSLDGIVTSANAQAQVSQDVSKDILVSAERTATIMGSVLDKANALAGLGFGMAPDGQVPEWAQWSRAGMVGLTAIPQASAFYAGAPRTMPPPLNPLGTPSGAPESQRISSEPPRPIESERTRLPGRGSGNVEGGARPQSGGVRASGPDTKPFFGETFDEGKGFNLGTFRRRVAERASERIEGWRFGQEQVLVDEFDQPIYVRGELQTRKVPLGTEGTTALGKVRLGPDGQPVGVAAEPAGWRERIGGIGSNIATDIVGGQTLIGATGKTLPGVGKALGAAGAIYAGGHQLLNFSESQTRKNQEFQRVLGGSANAGFGERWNQNMFRLGLRGSMSGRDAETIYKGALRSYAGRSDMREMFQDQAVNLYRNTGVGADEAAALLASAAREGNDSLNAFREAIEQVGETARDAGVNAEEARDRFSRAFSDASQVSTGRAAIDIASVQSGIQTHLGNVFGDIDMSETFSHTSIGLMANSLGVDQSKILSELAKGSIEGAALYAEGMQARVDQAFNIIDQNGDLRARWMEMFRERGYKEGDNIDPAILNAITSDLIGQTSGNIVAQAGMLQGILGMRFESDLDVIFYLFRQLVDSQSSFGGQASKLREESVVSSDQIRIAGGESSTEASINADPSLSSLYVDPSTGSAAEMKSVMAAREEAVTAAVESMGLDPEKEDIKGIASVSEEKWWEKSGDKKKDFRQSIERRARTTGYVEPIFGRIYQDFDDFKDSYFRMERDGEMVDYTLDEVLDLGLSGDILRDPSSVKIIGGKNDNLALDQIYNIQANPDAESGEVSPYVKEKAKDYGQDPEKTDKELEKDRPGIVTITLSDEARRYLQIESGGIGASFSSRGIQPHASYNITPREMSGGGS